MNQVARDGLDRLLQAGLEAGIGRLEAGDEALAERLFVLCRAYDPDYSSRFGAWIEALAGLRRFDQHLAREQYEAAVGTIKSLWETYPQNVTLRPALLRRVERARYQVPDEHRPKLDELTEQIEKKMLDQAWSAKIEQRGEDIAARLSLVDGLLDLVELNVDNPALFQDRIALLEKTRQVCEELAQLDRDGARAQVHLTRADRALDAARRVRDAHRTRQVLGVYDLLVAREDVEWADRIVLRLLHPLGQLPADLRARATAADREVQARQKERQRRRIVARRDFVRRHRRFAGYGWGPLVEAIAEGERLVEAGEPEGEAYAELRKRLDNMIDRRDGLWDMMRAINWRLERGLFAEASDLLEDLKSKGLNSYLGPDGKTYDVNASICSFIRAEVVQRCQQKQFAGAIAYLKERTGADGRSPDWSELLNKVVAEAEAHFGPLCEAEIAEASKLPDPRRGKARLECFLDTLPEDVAQGRATVEEAIQELEDRGSLWDKVDQLLDDTAQIPGPVQWDQADQTSRDSARVSRSVEWARQQKELEDRLGQLNAAESICPGHPNLKRRMRAWDLILQALQGFQAADSTASNGAMPQAQGKYKAARALLLQALQTDAGLVNLIWWLGEKAATVAERIELKKPKTSGAA